MVHAKRKIPAVSRETIPAKRKRVSRACDQCRLAREKCDGIQPTCFSCASSNRACSYTTSPKKRGMQTGYVRTLELSLAWSFTNIPGVEEGLKHALQDANVQATISGKDVEGSNKLHKKWRRSVICKRIDRLLSGVGPTDSHAEDSNASSEDEEEDSHIQQSAVGETTLLTPVSQPMGRINPNHSNERSLLDLCKATNSVSTTGPINLQQLKLPDNLWRLLDIFFAFTHSWFPTVEKHDILRISYSYPQDGLTITSGTP